MTCEKLYGVKTIRLLECHHALAHQEGSKPDFRWCTLSEFLNIAGGVVVAIDTILRSLKGKILLRINKSWVGNFPR